MAVGIPLPTNYTDGDVWSASDVNDITGTINTLGGSNYAAGKNKIINGDFGVWQRGAGAFTSDGVYSADRYNLAIGGSGTLSVTQQTFTPGTAPVSGYESQYFMQAVTASTSGTNDYKIVSQYIEDVRTFAGQTTTFSFWAKAASGTPKIAIEAFQSFGSGGSANVFTYGGQVTLSTSWARYSLTIAIPSVSGKTIGAGSFLGMRFWLSAGSDFNSRTGSLGNQNATFQIWGVQLEAGSTATAFQTATGTVQGELAACQRYYSKSYMQGTAVPTNTQTTGTEVGIAQSAVTSGSIFALVRLPIVMRVAPSVTVYSYNTSQTNRVSDGGGVDLAANSGNPVYISDRVVAINNNSGGNITPAGQHFLFHWAASAEL
jgi:hypothetical protein